MARVSSKITRVSDDDSNDSVSQFYVQDMYVKVCGVDVYIDAVVTVTGRYYPARLTADPYYSCPEEFDYSWETAKVDVEAFSTKAPDDMPVEVLRSIEQKIQTMIDNGEFDDAIMDNC